MCCRRRAERSVSSTVHPNAFFSFSTIISGRSPRFHDLLRAINPDRLLVESDFSNTTLLDAQVSFILAFFRPRRSQADLISLRSGMGGIRGDLRSEGMECRRVRGAAGG